MHFGRCNHFHDSVECLMRVIDLSVMCVNVRKSVDCVLRCMQYEWDESINLWMRSFHSTQIQITIVHINNHQRCDDNDHDVIASFVWSTAIYLQITNVQFNRFNIFIWYRQIQCAGRFDHRCDPHWSLFTFIYSILIKSLAHCFIFFSPKLCYRVVVSSISIRFALIEMQSLTHTIPTFKKLNIHS